MNEQTTVSRRAVAKGIAWAVPAVAVTAAAPAYAASGDCVAARLGSTSCLTTDGKTSRLTFEFSTTCTTGRTVSITSVTPQYKQGQTILDMTPVVVNLNSILLSSTDWFPSGRLSFDTTTSPDQYLIAFNVLLPGSSTPKPVTTTLSAPAKSTCAA